MSIDFRIKNKRKLFSYQEELTNLQLIQIIPNLSQYNFDEQYDNVNRHDFYNTKISNINYLRLGIENESIFGFLISYDKKRNEYLLSISNYATKKDWEIFVNYLSELSKVLNNFILDEGKQKFNYNTILNIDYYSVMKVAMEQIKERTANNHCIEIYGIKRPVIMGEKLNTILTYAADKVSAFENYIYKTQYPDAYVHIQTFHFNDGGKTIYGNYSIGDNLKCVIPKEPFIEQKNYNVDLGTPLTHWTLSITLKNNEDEYKIYKICEYNSFIAQLERNQYEELDDNFIILNKLTKEDFDKILENAKILDKYGQFIK